MNNYIDEYLFLIQKGLIMKNDLITRINRSEQERELILIRRILTGDNARWKILFDLRNQGFPTSMIIADLQRLETQGFITSVKVNGITVFAVI